jgi:hypothetical protein
MCAPRITGTSVRTVRDLAIGPVEGVLDQVDIAREQVVTVPTPVVTVPTLVAIGLVPAMAVLGPPDLVEMATVVRRDKAAPGLPLRDLRLRPADLEELRVPRHSIGPRRDQRRAPHQRAGPRGVQAVACVRAAAGVRRAVALDRPPRPGDLRVARGGNPDKLLLS